MQADVFFMNDGFNLRRKVISLQDKIQQIYLYACDNQSLNNVNKDILKTLLNVPVYVFCYTYLLKKKRQNAYNLLN
jgi:hypothetical protein